MAKNVYLISDHVYDSMVGLVLDTLDKIDEENFESRREYLGYIVELNMILDELQGVMR